MEPSNAAKLMNALTDFGVGSVGLNPNDLTVPDQVIQLGYPHNRIDLVTTPDGVDFATCYRARVKVPINGVEISFIDFENLKLNKKA